MAYIDNELRITIVHELGLQGLNTQPQERFGQKFLINYYWIAFLKFDTEENEILNWLIAVVKTNLWHRGLVGFVNGKNLQIRAKKVEILNWEDPVVSHLHNLNAVASLDDTWTLDGEARFIEMEFETNRTHGLFTVKELPDGNMNLEALWRKLGQVREFLQKDDALSLS